MPPSCLRAQKAFVVYADSTHQVHGNYITEHHIQGGVVQPGKWTDAQTFIAEFDKTHRPEKSKAEQPAWMPYHILMHGADCLVWHVPAKKRHLHFTEPRMKKLSGLLPVPGLVFKARQGSLSVHAIQSKHPAPDTRLYEAPFPNVYRGGDLCLGSMPRYGTDPSDAAKWTDAFFESAFSHYTYFKYWTAIKAGKKPRLKATDFTISDL